jgi:RNA methyltransferase, TrmH family
VERLGKERARKLAKLATGKGRREQDLLLLDSLPLVERALELGRLKELFVEEDRFPDLEARARAAGVQVTPALANVLDKLVAVETSPGAAGIASRSAPLDPASLFARPTLRLLYGERLADPGNLGTLARSAAAFGFDALICGAGSTDPESPKALRASAGALLSLPWLRADLSDLRAHLADVAIFRTVVEGGEPLAGLEIPQRALLWLGNEAQGVGDVPEGILARDLTIAMSTEVESLNVAAAAAILAHAFAR